ncbi:MAG: sortase [Chloroflexi bacterium]|nr:sortase [Chloroflexota bacterium]
MSNKIAVSELSLEELEAVLEERRRAERTQRFHEGHSPSRFQPITVLSHADRPLVFPPPPKIKRGRWRNRLLFAVEMIAVIGLIAILIGGLINLGSMENEFAEFRGTSVLTPSNDAVSGSLVVHPDVNAEITELPGSSLPPEDDQFPIPLGLSVKPIKIELTPPLIVPQSPTRIVIPAIGVDWPVVEGDDWESLKVGVGHRIGTPNPGTRGNMVLSGHNDVYGEVFKSLEFLAMNQDIVIYAGERQYRYVTRVRRIVPPTDLSPLNPSRDPIVTLITCWPYRVDTFRLIVVGELVE